MITTVLFDLDDTLFDHSHCARAALDDVRASYECFAPMTSAALERSHAGILEELHRDVMIGRLDLDVARTERFRRLFAVAGVDADQPLAARAAARYRQRYLAERRAVIGAAALLMRVRERAKVGIVSNNLLEEQQDKLRCCELDRYVDLLVVSEEAGISKPDPRIFEIALDRLRGRPQEAVMIGDSWDADVVGALAAGIRAIWFNPGMRDAERGMRDAVPIITSLEPTTELLSLIFQDRTAQP